MFKSYSKIFSERAAQIKRDLAIERPTIQEPCLYHIFKRSPLGLNKCVGTGYTEEQALLDIERLFKKKTKNNDEIFYELVPTNNPEAKSLFYNPREFVLTDEPEILEALVTIRKGGNPNV